MQRMASVGALLTGLFVSGSGLSQPKRDLAAPPSDGAVHPQGFAVSPTQDRAAEDDETAFDRAAARYARIAAFNRRQSDLEEERFTQEAVKYAELVAFTRKLEAAREAEQEKAFEARLSLAMKIRSFMIRLLQTPSDLAAPNGLAPEPPDWRRR